MTALSGHKDGGNKTVENCVMIGIIDGAIFFDVFVLKRAMFVFAGFLWFQINLYHFTKITFFQRMCDSTLRNVISDLKFCFCRR